MDLIVKHFRELSTTELYEILKTRFEVFVTEQECIYQDLDDRDHRSIVTVQPYESVSYKNAGLGGIYGGYQNVFGNTTCGRVRG